MQTNDCISEPLTERVLAKLGISSRPPATLEGLRAVYGAWCLRVPFDNVRKLVHLARGDASPFPGTTAEDFFGVWLRHGSGGTCWATSNALFTLLSTLGFDVQRCVATMLAAPNIPPNHGSVLARIGGRSFLVDTSILTVEPLCLDSEGGSRVEHPAWGVTAAVRDGLWHVDWRPLHKTDGFACRYERFGAEHREYGEFYEGTRGWSPFNYQLTARTNRGGEVIGMSFGNAVTLRADGSVESVPITDDERRRRLCEDFGMSEELVSQLPADRETPPPPGSKTAAAASAEE